MEVVARIPQLDLEQFAATPEADVTAGQPAGAVDRVPAPAPATRLPPFSVVMLALVAAAFWGAAWRNERLRLEAQRARPERFAQDLPATTGSTRADSR